MRKGKGFFGQKRLKKKKGRRSSYFDKSGRQKPAPGAAALHILGKKKKKDRLAPEEKHH